MYEHEEMRDAVEFLLGIPRFTKKNGLDHTRMLLKELGHPAERTAILHVAGSNGKGSVTSFLYHMLLAGKRRVGMFTSPHLVDIRERVQMNGRLCSEEEFLAAFYSVREAAERLTAQGLSYPSFFEFLFGMAMVMFERANLEYAILETGIGGLLDDTNSIDHPVMTVITSISLEHTEYLGDTIEEIAAHKAGILKPGVPVVFDGSSPAAASVIAERARRLSCPYRDVTKKNCTEVEFKNNFIAFSLCDAYDKKTRWEIPFAAEYQIVNAALAITAMRMLNESNGSSGCAVSEAAMHAGLLNTVWSGRMQEVLPGVYFDGAHNAAGITEFMRTVRRMTANDAGRPMLLFSMLREKDYHAAAEELVSGESWDRIAVTPTPNMRGIPLKTLETLFRDARGYADYREAFAALLREKREGQKLFCTGSLYFIGALLEYVREAGLC